jgi:hypothetical protein
MGKMGKSSWGVVWSCVLSLILVCAALMTQWVEFNIVWNPAREPSGPANEQLGLFSAGEVKSQGCYSLGACGIAQGRDMRPRYHRSHLSALQIAGLDILPFPVLWAAFCIGLVNLFFLFKGGFKKWLLVLPILLIAAVLLAFLNSAFFDQVNMIFGGGDSLPDWRSCPQTYFADSCTTNSYTHPGIINYSVGLHGTADWTFGYILPAGPLMLLAALLITIKTAYSSAQQAIREVVARSPGDVDKLSQ